MEYLGIVDSVTLLGQVSRIPDFLNALDGFVMPSWKEGCPLALMEAMAAGLPKIARTASLYQKIARN